jgi:hypothetical protein
MEVDRVSFSTAVPMSLFEILDMIQENPVVKPKRLLGVSRTCPEKLTAANKQQFLYYLHQHHVM